VVGSTTQPRTGIRAASSTARTGTGSGAGVILGDTAPSPSLFSGSDPLAGVLPGSWEELQRGCYESGVIPPCIHGSEVVDEGARDRIRA
jgi:hypothetical protein